jgi:phage N-6-adenine-methyltransferase
MHDDRKVSVEMTPNEHKSWSKTRTTEHSDKNDMRTPKIVFDAVNERFGPFTLDAAASKENTLVDTFYDEKTNALEQKWTGRVWCNPPYSRESAGIKPFVEKAWDAVRSGAAEVVVLLIRPLSCDTRYWHKTIFPHASHLVFIRGRLDFTGPYHVANGTSRWPSILVIFSQMWSGSGKQVLCMDNRGNWLTEEYWDNETLKLRLTNGVEATGQHRDNRFVVYRGSTANLEPRPSWRRTERAKRERLVEEGALAPEGDHLRFTRDVTFNSSSIAASIVRAVQSNGRKLWVTTDHAQSQDDRREEAVGRDPEAYQENEGRGKSRGQHRWNHHESG